MHTPILPDMRRWRVYYRPRWKDAQHSCAVCPVVIPAAELPPALDIAQQSCPGRELESVDNCLDFAPLSLPSGFRYGQDYVLAVTTWTVPAAQELRLAMGADWHCRWWVNGIQVHSTFHARGNASPPSAMAHDLTIRLQAGANRVAVEVLAGSDGFALWVAHATPELMQQRIQAESRKTARATERRARLHSPPTVAVDCQHAGGAFIRSERYHCIRLSDVEDDVVDAATRHFGRARIARVFGLLAARFYPGNMHAIPDEDDRRRRLRAISAYADELMVPVPHDDVPALLAGTTSVEAYQANAVAAILDLAAQVANPLWIEVFNESECGSHGLTEPEYVQVYALWQTVLSTLRSLLPGRRLALGGPSPCSFNAKRLQAWLDQVRVADTEPDFVAWHQYLFNAEDRPACVAQEIPTVRRWLEARRMNPDVPCFINENGVFPTSQQGPSLEEDLLTQATGVLSLHWWYQEQGGQGIPFHWTWSHANPRKNLFVPTLDHLATLGRMLHIDVSASQAQLTPHVDGRRDRLTPYGHAVAMLAKLPEQRLACTAGPQDGEGLGLYALAAGNADELAVLLWDYRWLDGSDTPEPVSVTMDHLPSAFVGRPLVLERWTLDHLHGHFLTGTDDLHHITESVSAATPLLQMSVPLATRSVVLIRLTISD
jgi:hypothetical protein